MPGEEAGWVVCGRYQRGIGSVDPRVDQQDTPLVTLGVLGPLQVNGISAPLSHRDRVVLAALAVTPGEVVPAESLAEALWGDSTPASSAKVVQGAILRLRRLLGRSAIESEPGGYRLTLAGDVDAEQFDRLVGRGRALAAVGEPSRAVVTYERALGLWRGTAFDELDGWLPGRSAARRLEEVRLVVEEEWLDAGLACGRAHELTGPAQRLAVESPHRERRWLLLATALYGAGRQTEALDVLRRSAATLLEEHGLDPSPAMAELEQAVLRQDPALPVGTRAVPGSTGGCPYPGLAAFDVEDTEVFFGREAEKATCLGRLATHPVLVVVGPSGCGKSSLVRAGVVPALARAGRRMAVLTPGTDPRAMLDEALSSAPSDAGLVVDQLEELFTLGHDPDVVREFLDRVAGWVVNGPVIITVRADHVGGLAASADLAHLADRGIHLLTPMSGPDIRRAIQEPALQAGLLLEPGLVDLLLRDVLGEPGALPLLSHALVETWERREGDVLTVDGYVASGGIRGAVAQSAERVFESLSPSGRETLRSLLLRLVTPSVTGDPVSTRLPVRMLRTSDAGSDVLDRLIQARLVTTDDHTVSVAHESLALAWPRLRAWLEEDVDGRRALGHLQVAADGWASAGRPDGELYRGGRLQTALEWKARSRPFLSQDEEDFLDESVRLENQAERDNRERLRSQILQNRRLRRLLGAVATFLVLALVAGGIAVVSGQRLQASERVAQDAGVAARDASAQARAARVGTAALLEPRADTSLLVARQAVELADTSQTSVDLLRALDSEQGLISIRDLKLGSNIGAQNMVSPDHRRLVSWQGDGIHLVDTGTGQELPSGKLLAVGQLEASLFPAGFVDAGRIVMISRPEGAAAGAPAREVVRYSSETGQQIGRPETVPGARSDDFWTADRLRVSPDGRHLVSMSGPSVRVWNREGGRWLGPLTFDVPGMPAGRPLARTVTFSANSAVAAIRIEDAYAPGWYAFPQFDLVVSTGTAQPLKPLVARVGGGLAQTLAVSPDGSRSAFGAANGVVEVRALGVEPVRASVQNASGSAPVSALAWTPDASRVAVGREDGSIDLIDADTGAPVAHYRGSGAAVSVLDLTRTRLVSQDESGVFVVRDIAGGGLLGPRVAMPRPQSIAVGPAGSPVAIGQENGVVALLDPATLAPLPTHLSLGPYPLTDTSASPSIHRRVTALAITADGRLLVAGDRVGHLRVWSLPDLSLVWSRDSSPVSFLAVSPDGKFLATAGFSPAAGDDAPDAAAAAGEFRLWNLADGSTVTSEDTHQKKPRVVRFSPDSRYVVVGFFENGAEVFDARRGSRVALLDQGAMGATFSRDSTRLHLSADNGDVSDYDTTSWTHRGTFSSPGGYADLEYSQDGRLLFVSSTDSVTVLDGVTHRLLADSVSLRGDGSNDALFLAAPEDRPVLYVASQTQVARVDLSPRDWLDGACRLAGRALSRDEWQRYLPDQAYQPACADRVTSSPIPH